MDNWQLSTDTAKKHVDLLSLVGYISLKLGIRTGF